VKSALKRAALVTLTRAPLASLFEPLTRRHAAIFYLHRFEEPGAGLLRHDTAQLRTTLEDLRRRRFTVLPLDGLLDRLAEGRPLRRTLAFTVDDGYMDFHSLGAPVFAEFDCPVTVFLTTGFLDGELWPWWDRIEYAFQRTTRRSLALALGDSARTFSWDRRDEAEGCRSRIVEALKTLPEPSRLAALDQIQDQLAIEIPAAPPPEYAPMNWEAVRADARRGVTFGPHSVTHPILSRADSRQSNWEIEESWNRVRAETDACIPVFCYPNGDPGSFGEREVATLRRLGLKAALTTTHRYATAAHFRSDVSGARYAIPRFAYPNSALHVIKIAGGLERATDVARVPLGRLSALRRRSDRDAGGHGDGVILMVAYHFAPDNASGTHRSLHFARSLESAGHAVWVLTTSLDTLSSVDPTLNALFPFPERVLRIGPAETLGVRYRRLKNWWRRGAGRLEGREGVAAASAAGRTEAGPGFLRRQLRAWDGLPDALRGWYGPAVRAGAGLRGRHKVAAVYASGPPWTGVRVGAALARRLGCPFVADFRDPWTVYTGDVVTYETWWARSMAARWERKIVAGAKVVLCNTPAMERSLREHHGGPGCPPIITILNGSDVPRREHAARFRAGEPLRIAYFGTLYRGRSVSPVTAALESLLEGGLLSEGEVHLEVVGGGDESAAPSSGARLGSRVRWLARPGVPFREAVAMMLSPKILLVVQEPAFDRQIPTKLYDYLCTGNPVLVLADEDSATWGMARRYSRCRRLDHRDLDYNVAALTALLATWRSGALEQERTVEDTATFTKAAVGEQFVGAMERVLDRR